jgi:lipoate-protein ligase A
MSAPLHLLDTGVMGARQNIALTAALAEMHVRGDLSDTLRLYAFPRSVLIGCSQPTDAAVNVAICVARRLEVARRVSGGGAVYMSPGVLTWDLIMNRRRLGGRLDAIGARVGEALAAALSRFGAPARFAPPNNVVIGERKVSGASGFLDGDTAVLQGTVLINADLDEMAAVLKGTSTVAMRAHVTTLAAALGAAPPPSAVKNSLEEALEIALGGEFERIEASTETMRLADRLLADGVGAADTHKSHRNAIAAPAPGQPTMPEALAP